MSDIDDEDEGEEKDGEGGGEQQPGRKKLLIILGVGLMLCVGGTAAAYFTGLLDPLVEMATGSPETPQKVGVTHQDVVFYELPEVLVNMNTAGRKSKFLKIKVSLELTSTQDVAKVEAVMPRIVDKFQVYLRELRVEDLNGSAGIYRLRGELLTRVSAAAAPTKISGILFKEMLLQ